MKIENIDVGDLLQLSYDQGAGMGMTPIYYRVLRKGKVKVFVRCEYGDEGWMYPASFDKKVIYQTETA